MNAQLQPGLFDAPIARRTDPESSHAAAQAVTASGVRGAQAQQCLNAVLKHPGRTSLELAEVTGICRYVLARRLSELEHANLVYKGALIRCHTNGRLAAPWHPGPDPMKAIALRQPTPAADAA